ncbi:hypothetical protein BJ138DRAFT_1104133 [Hygrophoropsis aurantiaca]|uniref:Uncharacterized protein n=1 Tax=Hygrophoropsis aurantiaca TaxID=72124 RepID=A0ACB8A4U6_9AGAM|nr:hypothetical protein BJ138DRAFT_1104133 [Hygrophoropsis aurantiaca]
MQIPSSSIHANAPSDASAPVEDDSSVQDALVDLVESLLATSLNDSSQSLSGRIRDITAAAVASAQAAATTASVQDPVSIPISNTLATDTSISDVSEAGDTTAPPSPMLAASVAAVDTAVPNAPSLTAPSVSNATVTSASEPVPGSAAGDDIPIPALRPLPVLPVFAVMVGDQPRDRTSYRGVDFDIPPPHAAGPFYLVTAGTRIGVYSTWQRASPYVTGVSRAVYTKATSRDDAMRRMLNAILSREARYLA